MLIKHTLPATSGNDEPDTRVYAPRSQAFFDAAGITGRLTKQAIDDFVLEFESAVGATRFRAIYPLVGGTFQAQRVNLVTPGTYDLEENGNASPVYTSQGLGTSGGGNAMFTGITNANSGMTMSNVHLACYVTTSGGRGFDMGVEYTDGQTNGLQFSVQAGSGLQVNLPNNVSINSEYTPGPLGLNTMTKTASTVTLYHNAQKLTSGSRAVPQRQPDFVYGLGAPQPYSYSSGRNYAFASYGQGISQTQVQRLSDMVQAMQEKLGRAV